MKKLNVSSSSLSTYIQIGILGALIVIAFLLGSLLEKSGNKTTAEKEVAVGTDVTDNQPAAKPATVGMDQIKGAFDKAVIKFGDTNKKVVFIEVSDPSCPYCQIAGGKNGELNKEAGDRFTLVADGGTYLSPVVEMKKLVDSGEASFALIYTNGHGAGEMAMKALYCAYEKGKFWEANDLIMSSKGYDLINNTVKNDKTKSGVLASFLSSAVNENDMKTCLDSGKYDAQLKTDSSTATSIGINGTPGFYVNETVFSGAYSYTNMESAVKSALGE